MSQSKIYPIKLRVNKSYYGLNILFLLSVWFLVGFDCNFKIPALKNLPTIQSKIKLEKNNLSEIKSIQKVNEQPSTLRDPFQLKMTSTDDFGKDPLEYFSLDSLKMAGTISEANKVWAIIQAPNEILYLKTVGECMGQNKGTISQINQKRVEVIENILINGNRRSQIISLSLMKENSYN